MSLQHGEGSATCNEHQRSGAIRIIENERPSIQALKQEIAKSLEDGAGEQAFF